MRDNLICLEGNVVRDIELLFNKDGTRSYTRNAIAVEHRKKDGDTWVSETSFFDFSILDEKMAENFCESVNKGDRVILVGEMRSRTVEDDEGNKRTFYGVIAENVGPSLKWATTTIVKNPKAGGASNGGGSTQDSGADFFD